MSLIIVTVRFWTVTVMSLIIVTVRFWTVTVMSLQIVHVKKLRPSAVVFTGDSETSIKEEESSELESSDDKKK